MPTQTDVLTSATAALTQQEIMQRLSNRKPSKIDPTTRTRTVAMEVLNLGLCRTGTASLRQALYMLGYYDVYHMASILEDNPPDGDMWVRAFDAKFKSKGTFGKQQWDQLLGHCMAVTDYPAAAFTPELVAAYPDAKVVISVRDNVDQWHKSVSETIWAWHIKLFFMRPGWLGDIVIEWLPGFVKMGKQLYQYCYEDDFPRNGRKVYEDHLAMCKRIVPPENLLIYNVKEGWAPLCKFLGKPIPAEPFPRVNDTKEFLDKMNERSAKIKKFLSTAKQVLLTVAGVGLAVTALRNREWLALQTQHLAVMSNK